MTTYQDVVRANGGVVSWALAEAAGLTFSPWLGFATMTGSGTFDYQQAGPFASALSLNIRAGSKIALDLLQPPSTPWTLELWVYVPAASVAAGQIIWFEGNAAFNGTGLTVTAATRALSQYVPSTAYALGPLLTSDAWHLIQWAGIGNGVFVLFLDGVPVYSMGTPGWAAPSPATLYIGGHSGGATSGAFRIAYPAIYGYAMNSAEALATFLASTDPGSALAYTQQGSAVGGISDAQLLQLIYAAVHKVW